MALEYDLDFADNFKTLNIVSNKTTTIPIAVDNIPVDSNTRNLNNELIMEIANLPLFENDKVTIKFSEVFNSNYNSVDLYKQAWSTNKNIDLTGKKLFETLKYNVSKLYSLFKDDSKFQRAMNVYLEPLPNTGQLDNGNHFPYLLAKRHMLFKITSLLYISFTVAEKTMCETEESQAVDYKVAKEQYNNLLKLLGDTTNLLLNIDVINKNPTNTGNAAINSNTTRDMFAMPTKLPATSTNTSSRNAANATHAANASLGNSTTIYYKNPNVKVSNA